MVKELIGEINQNNQSIMFNRNLFNHIVKQSMNEINQSTKSIESVDRANYESTKLIINQWSITKKCSMNETD